MLMEEVNETKVQEQTEINIGNDPVMLTAVDVVSKLMIQNKISLKARGNSIPNAVAVANIITEKNVSGKYKNRKNKVGYSGRSRYRGHDINCRNYYY